MFLDYRDGLYPTAALMGSDCNIVEGTGMEKKLPERTAGAGCLHRWIDSAFAPAATLACFFNLSAHAVTGWLWN